MTDLQKTPFVRELASSDRKTRDKALASLTLFLRSRTDLSLLELLKLWKGLFFCFYHSDRPLTQQALARSLSYSLVPTLPRSSVQRFLRAFWITIGREFHAIDRLRLDKYLHLIRCYVGVGFEVFLKEGVRASDEQQGQGKKRKREQEEESRTSEKGKGKKNKKRKAKQESQPTTEQSMENEDDKNENENKSKWSDLSSYLSILEEGPLCPLNFDPDQQQKHDGSDSSFPMPHGPDGLRYHIMDIWIDEIEKVLEFDAEDDNEDGNAEGKRKVKGDVPMDLLLRPIEKLRTESPHKPVRTRAAETLDDDRLVEWGFRSRKSDSEDEDRSDEEWGGFD